MRKPNQPNQDDLSIIQLTYDLILWYVPILNRLPRDHKFLLGDLIIGGLYYLLEELILARYEAITAAKLGRLEPLNGLLDLLRHQTRLLKDFSLIDAQRYGQASQRLNKIGQELGGWIKQQRNKQ
ncbi:MAG: diversity-generating retroelement protein Avd [Acidobacteriota bacterium]|nr:diversity-generating retroelement protein Avd [Acidobacteriota bacterium]